MEQFVAKYGIGLMCKAPQPGTSKTRLARDIGPVRAAELSQAFLIDAIATLRAASTEASARPYCFYKPDNAEEEIRTFTGADILLIQQNDGDLGAVMFSVLRRILQECPDGAALMGSDLPSLPSRLVSAAIKELRTPGIDAVYGPSEDGGYYLVAIKSEATRPLFEEIDWSTPTVMQETRKRAEALGLRILELDLWYDVDDITGLNRLITELSDADRFRSLGPARATRAALQLPDLPDQ